MFAAVCPRHLFSVLHTAKKIGASRTPGAVRFGTAPTPTVRYSSIVSLPAAHAFPALEAAANAEERMDQIKRIQARRERLSGVTDYLPRELANATSEIKQLSTQPPPVPKLPDRN